MIIDEARFKILEQNVQALQQTVYQILIRLSDLKVVLAGRGLLNHPEERSDIPPHSLFAQVKRFLEKEGLEFPEEEFVHTEPAKTCKACERNYRGGCTGDYYDHW